MYLTKINSKTGLVELEGEDDGIFAIKEFRELINTKAFGIQAFTCVALICDYLSPFRHYSENDREIKAMDQIYENRKELKIKNPLVQEAMIKYYALQYNHVIEEKKLLEEIKNKKLIEIRSESDDAEKMRKLKQLSDINKSLEEFNKKTNGDDLYSESPIRNGYKLSRLEQKLENSKSFYYVKEKSKPEQTI